MTKKDSDSKSLHFTKKDIAALPIPTEKAKARYFDTKEPGLAVVITDKGSRTFYFFKRMEGKLYEIKLGACQDLSPEQARAMAAETRTKIATGNDPMEAKRQNKKDPTFAELFEWYVETHARTKKDGGKKDEAQFRLYLGGLAKQKAKEVARNQMYDLHASVSKAAGPVAANRLLAMVKAIYNVAIEREAFGIISNPAARVKLAKEESRKRRLEGGEVTQFFTALEADSDSEVRDFLKIALYTGARKSNILAMRWDQINLQRGAWLIPGKEFKNGEDHEIPLPIEVTDILAYRRQGNDSPWVFPGRGKTNHMVEPKRGFQRILDQAGIADLHLHDLRRTLASFMAEAGVTENLIGRVLGHKPQSITGVYTRPTLDVLRNAMGLGISRMHLVAHGPQTVRSWRYDRIE